MVGGIEQELRPAGDGTIFADQQPIVVDWVVIQNILAFKLPRVGKIVVKRKITNADVGIRNDALQIADAMILLAGINYIGIQLHQRFLLSSKNTMLRRHNQ